MGVGEGTGGGGGVVSTSALYAINRVYSDAG